MTYTHYMYQHKALQVRLHIQERAALSHLTRLHLPAERAGRADAGGAVAPLPPSVLNHSRHYIDAEARETKVVTMTTRNVGVVGT